MKQNLNVIQLIDSLAPGGAEMMAVNIANTLAEDGVQSYLCTTRKEGDLKLKLAKNVGYLFLNKTSRLDFKAINKLHHFIKQHKINVIHAHSSSYFMGFIMKLLNFKLQLIWHDHLGMSESLAFRKKFPLIPISRYFNAVIVVNSLLLHWNQKYLNLNNIQLLQNFANFSTDEVKETNLKGGTDKRIVCLANLRPQKDHLNLLNAFLSIHLKNTDWTLHLVGMDFSDECAEKIVFFIKKQQLENHVFLYGSCSDTEHILQQATIGVLASNSEGLPVALLEYGLAFLPVVVTNVGACGSVVKNNVSGLVVPAKDAVSLAIALLDLMESKDKRFNFSQKLQKEVLANYSKKSYVTNLKKVYLNG